MRRSYSIIAAVIALSAVAAAVIWYYWHIDPAAGPAVKCVFKTLTGWDCPGCGSQRALHAVLHGRPAEAFAFNPFIFIMGPVALLYIGAELLRHRLPRLHRSLNHPAILCGIVAAVLLWWVLRNVF